MSSIKKSENWVEKFNRLTLSSEPDVKLFEDFISSKEEAIFFSQEVLKVEKTEENKKYYHFMKAVCNIMQSTMSFLR
jgi:hypothetical protein